MPVATRSNTAVPSAYARPYSSYSARSISAAPSASAALILKPNHKSQRNMMSKQCLLLLVVVAAVFCTAHASESEHVTVLGSDFDETVNDGKVWFIKFFAPWCGHCKRLAPTWGELATAFKDHSDIKIAHVDCTVDRDVCTEASIKGYPTLKVYYKGEEVKSYRGARDLDALKAFAEESAQELLTETTQ